VMHRSSDPGTAAHPDGGAAADGGGTASLPAGVAPGKGSPVNAAGLGSVVIDVPAQAPDGVDASGTPTSYDARNLIDGRQDTCWRMQGDGTGAGIMVTFGRPTAVAEAGLVNGYAKTDPVSGADRYAQERRILKVTWTFSDGRQVDQTLEDGTPQPQSVSVGSGQPVSWVYLRIDVVTGPGDPQFDYTAISELRLAG